MIDSCQEKNSNPSSFFFIFLKEVYFVCPFQLIGRDGINIPTVDHSDIRGLATACHGFVVELPLSYIGSWADGRIQKRLRGFSVTVIASLVMGWNSFICSLEYVSFLL